MATTSVIVDMNGSNDGVTVSGYNGGGGTTIEGSANHTYFTSTLIASGNGLAGVGGATPDGSDTQVQFNDGGSALGGDADYTWNKTTNKLTVNGDIEYSGAARDISDRRLKEDIEALPPQMMDRLMLLKPVSFRMKGRDALEYGLIAQDVEGIFPALVGTGADASRTKSLNYVGLIGPMLKGMQELRADNDNLRFELDDLRRVLRELKDGVGFRRTGTP